MRASSHLRYRSRVASPLNIVDGETIGDGLRRVAIAAVDDATQRLAKEPPTEKDIHETRKRLKELRALERLAGDGTQRIAMRDAGRALASSRDADALIEAFDKLRERFLVDWGVRKFGKIRRALVAAKQSVPPPDNAGVTAALQTIRDSIAQWRLDDPRFDLISRGLRAGYRRARRQMRTAFATRDPAGFHEWRKRVKEHWYHLQVIENAWPAVLGPHEAALHQLSRLLGDHHDLVVLRATIQQTPEAFGSKRLIRSFDRYVATRLGELEQEAEVVGRRLFEEKSRPWIRRIRAYWNVWRPEPV
jgi:hypothetical protein